MTNLIERNGIPYERLRDKAGRFITMNLPVTLELCPWCSESVSVKATAGRPGGGGLDATGLHFVECGSCGARGPCLGSPEDARAEWNSILIEYSR